MQPYFFPYIGYFQLMLHSDVFVLYDDVQYSKGGWINRNRILADGAPSWITLPVLNAPLRMHINQRRYRLENMDTQRIVRQIKAAYRKAPQFSSVFLLVQDIMTFRDSNVAAFNANLIRRIAAHLGIHKQILLSSTLDEDSRVSGGERVIHICKVLKATHYVNPIGGTRLYLGEHFAKHQIILNFLEPVPAPYPQFGEGFVPFLSIIDVMMFNSVNEIKTILNQFKLLD